MNKKIIWIFLLIIGLIPFLIAFSFGMKSAINGLDCLDDCVHVYGIKAFISTFLLHSIVFWPTYIIGIILIILSIIKLKSK